MPNFSSLAGLEVANTTILGGVGEWSEAGIRLRLSSAKLLTGTGTGTELGNRDALPTKK